MHLSLKQIVYYYNNNIAFISLITINDRNNSIRLHYSFVRDWCLWLEAPVLQIIRLTPPTQNKVTFPEARTSLQ